jgi:hypothetical protein
LQKGLNMAKPRTKHQAKKMNGRTNGHARPRGRPAGSTKAVEFVAEDFMKDMPHLEAVQWVEIQCPYCGETFDTRVDPSQEFANYIEDCQVCCKPIQLAIEVEEGDVEVSASRS